MILIGIKNQIKVGIVIETTYVLVFEFMQIVIDHFIVIYVPISLKVDFYKKKYPPFYQNIFEI